MKFHAFIRGEHEKSFISLRPGVQVFMVNVVSTVYFRKVKSLELKERRYILVKYYWCLELLLAFCLAHFDVVF